MFTDIQVAQYFLSKDPQREVFNKKLINKNGRTFYEGNARLNKYLHIAQNLHIAKTGHKLFQGDLYAYDNGAVSTAVQENYAVLWSRFTVPELSGDTKRFLDQIYMLLINAPLDELIQISHEDPEWEEKHCYYGKQQQRMDSASRAEEYREQYYDVLKVMEELPV